MNSWWWYLARSSGIVATILMIGSLMWGFFFSARATGSRLRPAWWLDLHNWLGGLSLAFTALHVVTVFADSDLGIGLKQILVPGTATDLTWAMSFGVVATYVLVVVCVTSIGRIRRRMSRRLWRVVHLTSVPMVVVAVLHAYQSGSDAVTLAFRVGLIATLSAAVYPLGLRLSGVVSRALRPAADLGRGA